MTRSIIVGGLCLVALAGCGRTVVRETVVERPVVQRETVVAPTVALAAPAACALGGNAFASGSLSCQSGYQYQCSNGVWQRIPNSYC